MLSDRRASWHSKCRCSRLCLEQTLEDNRRIYSGYAKLYRQYRCSRAGYHRILLNQISEASASSMSKNNNVSILCQHCGLPIRNFISIHHESDAVLIRYAIYPAMPNLKTPFLGTNEFRLSKRMFSKIRGISRKSQANPPKFK